jgi:hypothetical protein
MSLFNAELTSKWTPFYAILQNGLERMFSVLKSDNFTFVVNGQVFESTVAEAVLLSPKVHETLRLDPDSRTFVISSDIIDSSSFRFLLELIRCHAFDELNEDKQLSVLSLCSLLENEHLTLVLLSSFHSTSISTSVSTSA